MEYSVDKTLTNILSVICEIEDFFATRPFRLDFYVADSVRHLPLLKQEVMRLLTAERPHGL